MGRRSAASASATSRPFSSMSARSLQRRREGQAQDLRALGLLRLAVIEDAQEQNPG